MEKSDGILHESRELKFGLCKTAKKLIFKRCAWYYKYIKLFCNYPDVNLAAIIKSEQLFCRKNHTINDNKHGVYNKNLNLFDFNISKSSINLAEQYFTNFSKNSDFSSLYSVLSQIVQD